MANTRVESVHPDELDIWLDWRGTVLEEVFADVATPLSVDLRARNREYVRRHLADDTCVLCFARSDEGRIVGCGGACLWDSMPCPENVTGRIAFLMSIYVVPELRGGGIATQIVRWILDETERRGIQVAMLETTAKGLPVYEKLGFRQADGYMIRYGKKAR